MKALAPTGAAVVGQEFRPDPVALGQPALSLLDVVPVVQHATPEFAYLRQTVRTNNAAVVAEGATKPTSVYSVNRVEQSLVVVAHLSEGIPRYWLLDSSALEQFVASELGTAYRWPSRARCSGTSTAPGGSRRRRTRLGPDDDPQGPDQAGDGGLRGWLHRAAPPETGAALRRARRERRRRTCRTPRTTDRPGARPDQQRGLGAGGRNAG